MKKGRFTEEQILGAVQQMANGRTATEIAREMGVSKHTIYGRNQKYGGMSSDDAKRLKHLEEENRRLKIAVADLMLDRDVLKAVISKKRVELVSRREDVAFAMAKFPISQRKACELMQIERSSCRYEAKPERQPEVREEVNRMAEAHPRYGYRRVTAVLRREGRHVNHKRICRLRRQLGLLVRRTVRKPLKRQQPAPVSVTAANQQWAMDFVSMRRQTAKKSVCLRSLTCSHASAWRWR